MAYGIGEDPSRSVSAFLESVEYPTWREQLEKAVMDGGGNADVINLFKSLPRSRYESKEEVQRDLSEASRRFAMGKFASRDEDGANRDRRNIGRDAVEGAVAPLTRHP